MYKDEKKDVYFLFGRVRSGRGGGGGIEGLRGEGGRGCACGNRTTASREWQCVEEVRLITHARFTRRGGGGGDNSDDERECATATAAEDVFAVNAIQEMRQGQSVRLQAVANEEGSPRGRRRKERITMDRRRTTRVKSLLQAASTDQEDLYASRTTAWTSGFGKQSGAKYQGLGE